VHDLDISKRSKAILGYHPAQSQTAILLQLDVDEIQDNQTEAFAKLAVRLPPAFLWLSSTPRLMPLACF
jgi:hypothetical protein